MFSIDLRMASALAVLLSCTAGPAVADGAWSNAAALQRLDGVYESSAPEPWYGGFGTRQFTLDDGTWTLTFTHALDPAMTMKTFRFRTGGPYTVGSPSATVAGAFEAVFGETAKHVTLLTTNEKIIAGFGLAACGLAYNVEKDISETGCGPWKPVRDCGEDHDLLALQGDKLYFGVRPAGNDMCTADKRPTALFQPVARR